MYGSMSATGHQRACCCVTDCEWCLGDTTQRLHTLTLSGTVACGCLNPGAGGTFEISVVMAATVTLTQVVGSPCKWEGTAGTLTRKVYSAGACTGDVLQTQTVAQVWTLEKLDGQWYCYAQAPVPAGDYGANIVYLIFDDYQNETDCTANVTFTNDWAVGDCNANPSGNLVVGGYDGTATM